jgi:hypothetical protein
VHRRTDHLEWRRGHAEDSAQILKPMPVWRTYDGILQIETWH